MILTALLAAASFQPPATLDRAVSAFTGHAIGEEGGARAPVDPRLRLAACPMLSMSWRSDAHDAAVATCTGPDWRIFVPVIRPAQAAIAAAAAPAAIVKAEPVIRRGDPVVIEAGQDGFSITREGVAAGDAAPGARVAVRIEGATAPVQAVALASGRAVLPGFGQ